MRPIKISKKEWGLGVLAAGLAIASLRPFDLYVFVPMLLISWAACLYLAYHHEGERQKRVLFAFLATCVLGFITWRNFSREKSVLTMEAHMSGAWGPNVPHSQVDFDINNPPDDSIQNLDLTISRASKMRIKQFGQISTAGDDCSLKPINDFQHYKAQLEGSN